MELFDPLDGTGYKSNKNNNNSRMDENKIISNKKRIRNTSFDNLDENNTNNNNNNKNINNVNYNEIKYNAPRGSYSNNPNREEDDYGMQNEGGLKKETLICSGEEFYDMEEDDDNNKEDDKYEKQIKIKTSNNNINNINILNNNNYICQKKEININENKNRINETNNIYPNESIKFKELPNIKSINSIPNKYVKSKKGKYFDPLYEYEKRTSLPSKKVDLGLNLWKIFKNAVGKDISRFGVPVYFNEPLSSLQRFCEPFQYAQLLNSAAKDPNPYIRIAKAATFCISQVVMNNGRQAKFFNPLLYETYEYIDNKLDYRYMAEQVSHHPAITAYYAEGNGWNIYANTNAVIKFKITGRIDVNALGRTYLTFTNFNDVISFTKPSAVVKNLIIGTIDIDIEGKFEVTNEMGDMCEVEMIPSTSDQKGKFNGKIKDINGDVKYFLEGNWQEAIYLVNKETGEKINLWKIIPSYGKDDFYYQPISFDLNYLTEEMKTALPPTDSRFRPDQRLLEYQDIDKAADEKHRLEEEQRARAKKYKEEGFIPRPLYFDETYDDLTGELIYKYKGNYWDMRYNKKFDDLPKLFNV